MLATWPFRYHSTKACVFCVADEFTSNGWSKGAISVSSDKTPKHRHCDPFELAVVEAVFAAGVCDASRTVE
jgi:hypothetical protein